ncbi:hypothetical protein [Pelagibacterium mangrovi]|uniref:hypothetical protein n=1 Tax=Pelagibacterium mangrovi TaxID=3119828 RepID=UPI002FC977D3
MSQSAEITQRMHSVNGVMEPQSVLFPTVDMLSDKIARVPAGQLRELDEIREELAREYGTDITCPITTRRHLKVIAIIAHSAVAMGDPKAVPFWRVVDPAKPNAERLAGGRGFIVAQQTKERRAGAR